MVSLKEFMVWGGSRDVINHFYVWAYDADSAIQIARLKDSDICAAQWTGRERKKFEGNVKTKVLADRESGVSIGRAIYMIEDISVEDAIYLLGGRILPTTDPEYNEDLGNVIFTQRYKLEDLFLR